MYTYIESNNLFKVYVKGSEDITRPIRTFDSEYFAKIWAEDMNLAYSIGYENCMMSV